MLNYNFTRIFKARGIERPFTFLTKSGFSDQFATKVKNNRVKVLRLKEMERLCMLLKCTPNDLLEWMPDQDSGVDGGHPLHTIRKTDKVIDLTKTLNAIPLDQLDTIEAIIHQHLGKTDIEGG